MEPLRVLSLFDGMSGTMLALKHAGIPVHTYYASEIDKHATEESEANFPEIVRLGDVTKWQSWDIEWDKIDLLVGGFPCQSWSVAGKQTGDNDPRGMLFHTMMDILAHLRTFNEEVKFLFENVKMKDDFKNYITGIVGCDPVFINSEHFTAHNRQRYYWCNWELPFMLPALSTSPKLPSILESGYVDRDKSYCIDANYHKGGDGNQYFNKSRRQMVFFTPDIDKDYIIQFGKNKVDYRKLTVVECCRLQGVPDTYFKVSSDTQAYKMLGNGFTVPVISFILTHMPR